METVSPEKAEQLINKNEAAPATSYDEAAEELAAAEDKFRAVAEQVTKAGDAELPEQEITEQSTITAEELTDEQVDAILDAPQDEENAKFQQQLVINGLVEWACGVIQQTQEQMNHVMPQCYQWANANSFLDTGKLWLQSMFSPEAAEKAQEMTASNPTQDSPDIWLPEQAGEVAVPTLHVVGEAGSSPEPAGNATEEGGS